MPKLTEQQTDLILLATLSTLFVFALCMGHSCNTDNDDTSVIRACLLQGHTPKACGVEGN